MDNHTPEQRRKNMQAIKSKDTSIELILRRELWSRGIRYRKNYCGIIGHPDIVILGKKVAIFCDSSFWHGHDWEHKKDMIKSNRDYWVPKIERNIQRDKEVSEELISEGWKVLRFWDFQLKNDLESCVNQILDALDIFHQ